VLCAWESVQETRTVTMRRPARGVSFPETVQLRWKTPPPLPSARSGFAGSLYTPGDSCAAPRGKARRASSCCCASAVAAVTESAVLSMRVSETELTAKPPTPMPMKAIVPSASRIELPREPRRRVAAA